MKIKKIAAVLSLCSAMILPAFNVNAADGLPTKAYISGEIGAVSVWKPEDATIGSTVAEINGDAQYEVVWKVSDVGTADLNFLALSIPNITSDSYPNIDVKIDEIYIDGVKANYTMSSNAINTAYYEPSREPETRVYIYDNLKGTNVADLPKLTTIMESIKVVFTVSGTGVPGTSNVTQIAAETQASSETQATEDTTQGDPVYGSSSPVDASTTGDAGVAAIAVAGLAITAGAAVLSKVKFKKKK